MKSFMTFVLFLAVSVCFGETAVEKAHSLKAKGDYANAAEAHPNRLCKSIYYWNAACQIVGHRDSNGDWAINKVVTGGEKEMGNALLDKAQAELDGHTIGCEGVDVETLQKFINAVRKEISKK